MDSNTKSNYYTQQHLHSQLIIHTGHMSKMIILLFLILSISFLSSQSLNQSTFSHNEFRKQVVMFTSSSALDNIFTSVHVRALPQTRKKTTTTKHFTLIQTSDTLLPSTPPPPPSFHPVISPQPLQINLQNIDLRSKGVGG